MRGELRTAGSAARRSRASETERARRRDGRSSSESLRGVRRSAGSRTQRYCLECGARNAAVAPTFGAVRGARSAAAASPAAAQPPAYLTSVPPQDAARALRGPAPAAAEGRRAVALVLLMLGFGVVIGEAARKSVQDTLVAARPGAEAAAAGAQARDWCDGAAFPGAEHQEPRRLQAVKAKAKVTPSEATTTSATTPAACLGSHAGGSKHHKQAPPRRRPSCPRSSTCSS